VSGEWQSPIAKSLKPQKIRIIKMGMIIDEWLTVNGSNHQLTKSLNRPIKKKGKQ
jgi:hypothetical protein